jgi:hypothetical protein
LIVLSFSEAQELEAVCQRRPVDLFAVFVPHPNEAPAILMGASVVTYLSGQFVGVPPCAVGCAEFLAFILPELIAL